MEKKEIPASGTSLGRAERSGDGPGHAMLEDAEVEDVEAGEDFGHDP